MKGDIKEWNERKVLYRNLGRKKRMVDLKEGGGVVGGENVPSSSLQQVQPKPNLQPKQLPV